MPNKSKYMPKSPLTNSLTLHEISGTTTVRTAVKLLGWFSFRS